MNEAKDYRSLALEVVALGENLFEMALQGSKGATAEIETSSEEPEVMVEEIRVAADEFFVALRLLLGLPEVEG
jgi:hypothetical protein